MHAPACWFRFAQIAHWAPSIQPMQPTFYVYASPVPAAEDGNNNKAVCTACIKATGCSQCAVSTKT